MKQYLRFSTVLFFLGFINSRKIDGEGRVDGSVSRVVAESYNLTNRGLGIANWVKLGT